jgi:hypothetical protein
MLPFLNHVSNFQNRNNCSLITFDSQMTIAWLYFLQPKQHLGARVADDDNVNPMRGAGIPHYSINVWQHIWRDSKNLIKNSSFSLFYAQA